MRRLLKVNTTTNRLSGAFLAPTAAPLGRPKTGQECLCELNFYLARIGLFGTIEASMKRILFAFALPIAALPGCRSQEHFVQQNMLYYDFEVDRAACETKAIQEIESSHQRSAEIALSAFKIAYGRKDAHASARTRNYEACMLSKGYRRVELKRCTNSKAAQRDGVGPLSVNRRVTLDSNSCAVSDNKGRVFFSHRSHL
ncbi:hypothetical protein [Cognatishimia sp.]|uniref:hypothetical protein n=1 Tax=Cognatishimia sp. TaxID=2211648 RepID=UPI003513781E|nr:hypothetical protein [Cognatishimia sp.]